MQAVGQLPPGNPIPWRGNALLYEQAPKLGFDDLTGGWMQGGVAGRPLSSAWASDHLGHDHPLRVIRMPDLAFACIHPSCAMSNVAWDWLAMLV